MTAYILRSGLILVGVLLSGTTRADELLGADRSFADVIDHYVDQKLTTAFRPRARALGVVGLPPGLIKTCAPGWREKPGRTWML